MSPRALLRLAPLAVCLALAACATGVAARRFSPASEADARAALEAWEAIRQRTAELPSSRLLYDAKMGKGSVAAIPGTLAVTYTGGQVRRASLTGPFGSRVAEYAEGAVTGEDRKALVVDPEALRSVLAGTWPGPPSGVAGCDGDACLLVWEGRPRVAAVVDRAARQTRTLSVEGDAGKLVATYSGAASPWPERIGVREERSARSLALRLVAVEPQAAAPAYGR
ncbi:MAG: hypothetical protein WAU32_12940 [Thermoanaerobaculia bacterium]